MDKFLSDAINTALTAAANKAVDATIREAFTATIDKAVKTQAKKLDKAFAAAVDNAVADRLDHLNALVQKATEIRIDKAVKKAVLEAKIEEMQYAYHAEREMLDKINSGDTDPGNGVLSLCDDFGMRMTKLEDELFEFGEEQEENVYTVRGTIKRGPKHMH